MYLRALHATKHEIRRLPSAEPYSIAIDWFPGFNFQNGGTLPILIY